MRVILWRAMLLCLAIAALVGPAVAAQDATPAATEAAPVEVMFVQTFSSGRLEPTEERGAATLTLEQPVGAVYFSNRPERIAGTVATGVFLQELERESADPLNAALVIDAPERGEVVAVELLNGSIDDTGTVVYEVRILSDADELPMDVTQTANLLTAVTEPLEFGPSRLFVDDFCASCAGSGF